MNKYADTRCRICDTPLQQTGFGRPRTKHAVCPEVTTLHVLYPKLAGTGIPDKVVPLDKIEVPAGQSDPETILLIPQGDAVPYEIQPGSIEDTLKAELGGIVFEHPMARTLASMALKLARAADCADPSDLKATVAAQKALQACLNDIARSQGVDDDGDLGPFGAVRAQVVNT